MIYSCFMGCGLCYRAHRLPQNVSRNAAVEPGVLELGGGDGEGVGVAWVRALSQQRHRVCRESSNIDTSTSKYFSRVRDCLNNETQTMSTKSNIKPNNNLHWFPQEKFQDAELFLYHYLSGEKKQYCSLAYY